MDSSLCDHQVPSPRSLRSLVCEVKYPHGNYLIHQFVLNNPKPSDSCSESYIRAVLRSFPGEWVNARNKDRFTALHLAVLTRNSFMVKELLSRSSEVNAIWLHANGNYGSALHFAAYLITPFSFKGYYNYGKIKLDKVFNEECLKIVKVLLERGALIDIKDARGRTLLHVAAKENQTDLIKLLISSGAELNIRDREGETPLHEAIKKSDFGTVKLLVECGANINEKSYVGYTPFHLAVKYDLRDIIKYLISRNVDLNTVAKGGKTPLHSAVESFHFIHNTSLKTVSDLVEKGANLNLIDDLGETPLHIAAKSNQIDVMKILIINGAELNFKNKWGETPLHNAIISSLESVKLLVESGADVNVKSNCGSTPYRSAVNMRGNHMDVIEYLKSRNAYLNTVNRGGWTKKYRNKQQLRNKLQCKNKPL